MNKYPIVEPRNGRNEEYKQHLRDILESGACPFCPGGDTLKNQEMIGENEHWYASRNYHPLANTLHHFLFIPKRHIEERIELTGEELRAFVELEEEIKQENNISGSAIYSRDGDPMITGATVAHLHIQMIVPEGIALVHFGGQREA